MPVCAQTEGTYEVVHPNQRVTVQKLIPVTAADTSSAATAKAAVATALSASKVKCGPGSQLENVLDATATSSLRVLATRISSSICINNGQRLRITATFEPRQSIQADTLIAPLHAGKPLLMEWKNNLYVLYGVVYDEHRYSDGHRDNVIRELLLIDPRRSYQPRIKTFVRAQDKFADVEGVSSLSVAEH